MLERLDCLVARSTFENRAEIIRAALLELARREPAKEIDEQIEAGYLRIPQGIESVGHPDFTSWNRLDDEDWTDWAT